MERIPMSVLAGLVQSHLDLVKLIPTPMLAKPSVLSKAVDSLAPAHQADLARALHRLRVCGEFLAGIMFEIDSKASPPCPGCRSAMVPTMTGGWGCTVCSTPSCIRSTR